MRAEIVIAFAVAALGAGVLLIIAGTRGTTAPPGPPSRTWARLHAWITGAGLSAGDRNLRYALATGAVILAAAVWLFTRIPIAGLLAGAAVVVLPWVFNVDKPERMATDRLEALGEWIHRLRDGLGTGTGLRAAIVASASTAPKLLAADVAALAATLQEGQIPAWTALRRFADQLADPMADRVVIALNLHLADHGERLGDVLGTRTMKIAKEVTQRREVHSERKPARSSIRFMTVYTVAVLLVLLINPSLNAPLRGPAGQLALLVVLALFAGILIWVRVLCSPRREPRLLTPVNPADVGA